MFAEPVDLIAKLATHELKPALFPRWALEIGSPAPVADLSDALRLVQGPNGDLRWADGANDPEEIAQLRREAVQRLRDQAESGLDLVQIRDRIRKLRQLRSEGGREPLTYERFALQAVSTTVLNLAEKYRMLPANPRQARITRAFQAEPEVQKLRADLEELRRLLIAEALPNTLTEPWASVQTWARADAGIHTMVITTLFSLRSTLIRADFFDANGAYIDTAVLHETIRPQDRPPSLKSLRVTLPATLRSLMQWESNQLPDLETDPTLELAKAVRLALGTGSTAKGLFIPTDQLWAVADKVHPRGTAETAEWSRALESWFEIEPRGNGWRIRPRHLPMHRALEADRKALARFVKRLRTEPHEFGQAAGQLASAGEGSYIGWLGQAVVRRGFDFSGHDEYFLSFRAARFLGSLAPDHWKSLNQGQKLTSESLPAKSRDLFYTWLLAESLPPRLRDHAHFAPSFEIQQDELNTHRIRQVDNSGAWFRFNEGFYTAEKMALTLQGNRKLTRRIEDFLPGQYHVESIRQDFLVVKVNGVRRLEALVRVHRDPNRSTKPIRYEDWPQALREQMERALQDPSATPQR